MKKATRRNRARTPIVEEDVRFRKTNKQRFLEMVREEEEYETKTRKVPELLPKNNNQRTAIRYLQDDKKKIVFLTGSAGTGKSMLAAYRAAERRLLKKVDKIYLVRPAVSVGKSVGMLPGDIKEKLAPYFAQTMAHLEKFLGKGEMAYCIEKNIIEMKPVEYLRGMSFENCIVIAEEVQNFTREEMEMMLTRLGDDCQIIFTGDTKQHDLRGESGLSQTVKLLDRIQQTHPSYMNREDMNELDDGIGIVQFTPEDVVRSGLTKAFVKIFYNNDEKD